MKIKKRTNPTVLKAFKLRKKTLSNFVNNFMRMYQHTDLTFEQRVELFVSEFCKHLGNESIDFKNYLALVIETDPSIQSFLKKYI
ncbi:MAG: hypothetical protein NZO16_04490 [Deltaproteobacteria bacterium]|nr:hypothetical protein [Deltaproteobacteria bacterium]